MFALSWQEFVQAFIPLFVAMDVAGTIPFYISITSPIAPHARRKVIWQSLITAGALGSLFLLAGNPILKFLGITLEDFKIGGGIVLLVLAVLDLIQVELTKRDIEKTMGVFPLGTPLIVGPAVLTSLLIQDGIHGTGITALAFVVNLFIVMIVFLVAGPLTRLLGESGTKAISKITALLLAAYAVMLIRSGLETLLN
jgi:multiple antibiotic resistance protein